MEHAEHLTIKKRMVIKYYMKSKQIETMNKRKTNCPLNEPEDYPLQDMIIFYGWTST